VSIALFDEPPRVRFGIPSAAGGNEGLLVGITMDGLVPYGVCVTEDGSLTVVHGSQLNVGWRYDPETDRWADVNAQEGAQEG
jgi:hypothetical protein